MSPTTQVPSAASSTSREKRIAFLVLGLALAAQIVWMFFNHFSRKAPWRSMSYPLEFALLPFLLLLLTGGRVRWIASLLRLPFVIAFGSAVCDRFGWLGKPGTPGVSWGDFAHFIAYTGQVNSFMPAATIPALAVLATIGESACAIALLLGIHIRWSALAAAVLLFLFATAMTISGFSQFSYGVYAMCAGAWALSTVDASLLSIDALTRKRSA